MFLTLRYYSLRPATVSGFEKLQLPFRLQAFHVATPIARNAVINRDGSWRNAAGHLVLCPD